MRRRIIAIVAISAGAMAQQIGALIAGVALPTIAGELGVAERTVKAHRARVLQKMAAGSIAELTRTATLLGM